MKQTEKNAKLMVEDKKRNTNRQAVDNFKSREKVKNTKACTH